MNLKAGMAYFLVLSWYSPGGNDSQDSFCPNRDSNWAPPKQKKEALLSEETCFVGT
jgi:hypothetical protein